MIRRLLYFIVGFLMVTNIELSYAISPTNDYVYVDAQYRIGSDGGCFPVAKIYSDPQSACSGWWSTAQANCSSNVAMQGVTVSYSGGWCNATYWMTSPTPVCESNWSYDSSVRKCKSPVPQPSCPAGYTLNSDKTDCVPDKQCEPSQILRDGQCVCDPAHLAAFPTAYGGAMEGAGSAPDQACVGGCMRKSGDFCLGGGNKWWCSGGAWTTQTCSGGPTDTKMPDNKKPPCAASEGVLTSSKGTVACVPEGTPDARKPGITEKKKTETFPDGSKKETKETTTRDPATNATETTTTTTTTAGPTGGTSAGTTGTTTTDSSQNSSKGSNGAGGDGDGGDGDCDPTLNFCGGPKTDDLYTKKEKTVSSVLNTFTSGIKNSQLGSAMNGFFTITTPSGGCPNWVINVSYLNTTVDLSQYFCTGTAINMMDLVGSVLLALASFVAFRWAIL